MSNESPPRRRIVVDGSNIATEGRTLPSLAQLDEAIRTFLDEFPGFTTSDVTVVVDASFGHRIDPSEVADFEEAVLHGEMVTPPAGAVGRGDGFILRIAEKSGALVLSNDSFQEFHAERPWLFDDGRLIGGKPVPGIGWVFTPRTPVRGPKSRAVTSRSRRDAKIAASDGLVPDELSPVSSGEGLDGRADDSSGSAEQPRSKKAEKVSKVGKGGKAPKAAKTTKADKSPKTSKASKSSKKDEPAGKPAKATKATKATKASKSRTAVKAVAPSPVDEPTTDGRTPEPASNTGRGAAGGSGGRTEAGRRPAGSPPAALNDPMTFLTFVADHPVGSTVEGTVVSFTSHGAHVDVGAMRCHVPLQGLANPPPIKARDVVSKGETRQFILVSLDAARRRAELALPGVH
jgi:Zc3h12a-like Ribonuclease NYN domain/S1 RNA binding domain